MTDREEERYSCTDDVHFLFFDRLVGDNIHYETHARIQSKEHRNCSIHWTHQYAILDRVQDATLEKHPSQKDVDDVQLIELLPDKDVQANFRQFSPCK